MLLVFMSVFVALNLIVIFIKYEKRRYFDLAVDVTALILIMSVFAGTNDARVIGTFASMMISVYLYFKPPRLPTIPKDWL